MTAYTLPELHCPFPSTINQYVEAAQHHTLSWVKRFNLITSDSAWRHLEASKFGWLAASAFPNAPFEELKIVSDWNTWLFIRDDQCDESDLGHDPVKLACFHERWIEILMGGEPRQSDLPLTHALHDICRRLRQKASNAWMCHFTQSVIEYFESSAWEAENRASRIIPDPKTYMAMRPFTGGLYTDIELIYITERIYLPLHVRKHDILRRLARMANNVVCWSNDIISFAKEMKHNETHNLVLVLQYHYRLTPQEAIQKAAELTNKEINKFVCLQGRLPTFSTANDANVKRFIAVLRSWMRGNLDWSYISDRYKITA
jgi:hypothetical protein